MNISSIIYIVDIFQILALLDTNERPEVDVVYACLYTEQCNKSDFY